MFIVEWLAAEEDIEISVVNRNKTVTLHLLSSQGALLVALDKKQADLLAEQLRRIQNNG